MRVRGACLLGGRGRCGLGLGGRWRSGARSGPRSGAVRVRLFCMVASVLLAPGESSISGLSGCGECVLMRFSEGYVDVVRAVASPLTSLVL